MDGNSSNELDVHRQELITIGKTFKLTHSQFNTDMETLIYIVEAVMLLLGLSLLYFFKDLSKIERNRKLEEIGYKVLAAILLLAAVLVVLLTLQINPRL